MNQPDSKSTMPTALTRMVLVVVAAALLVTGVLVTAAWAAKAAGGKTEMDAGKENDAAWSAPVNGVKARLKLAPEQVSNGTPLIETRLELKNVSDIGNSLKFAWTQARMKFRVTDQNGTEQRAYHGPWNGSEAIPLDLVLPYKGELSFDISRHGAGVRADQLAMIDLGATQAWVIPRDGKAYFLQGTLEVAEIEHARLVDGWYGKIEFPAVRIPVNLKAMDAVTTGKLIEELGPKILHRDDRVSEDALKRLSLINDDRVVPWYLKAVQSKNYELKFAALDRLSRFTGDQALDGLKMGMITRGKDIADCSTTALADQLAENIRHATAGALVQSHHPEAKKLLMTMWQDPSYAVRIDVVQAAANMNTLESLTILKKLTKDANEEVRTEAAGCLKVREQKQRSDKH